MKRILLTAVEELGMSYVPLPVGREDITFETAKALDELLASYDEPVLVHCRSANRVGALLALRASANGADDKAAIEAGRPDECGARGVGPRGVRQQEIAQTGECGRRGFVA